MHSRRSLTSIFLVVFDLFISLTYAVNCPVDSDCWKQLAKSPIAPEDYLHPLADGSVRTPRHETYVDINDRTTTYNQIYDTAHTYIHDINEQCHLYNHGIKQKDPQYNVTAPELRQPIKKAAMAKIRSRLDDLGTEFTRLAAQLESLKQDNHTDIPAPIFQPIPERIDATLPAYKPLVHPGPPFHLIDHGDLPENYHSDNHPYTKEARWCGQVMARMFRELDDSYTKVHKVDWCRSDFDKLRAPIRAILKAGAVWQPAWGYATGDVSFLQGFYDALDDSVGGPPDQFWAKWRCPYAMIQSVRREYHLEWLKGQNGYGGGVILDGLFGISRRVRRA